MSEEKSELGDKYITWLESTEGKECRNLTRILNYELGTLTDRLERAFLAGANATNEIAEELASRITKS